MQKVSCFTKIMVRQIIKVGNNLLNSILRTSRSFLSF